MGNKYCPHSQNKNAFFSLTSDENLMAMSKFKRDHFHFPLDVCSPSAMDREYLKMQLTHVVLRTSGRMFGANTLP